MTAEQILQYCHSREGLCDARDFLSGYLRLDAAQAVKLSRLDALRSAAGRLRALHSSAPDELAALEKEILADYSVLLQRQKSIGDAIRRVPDEMSRLVLESRYLEGLPFFRIAMNLHFDERQIYRYHRRGLEHIAAQLAAGKQ